MFIMIFNTFLIVMGIVLAIATLLNVVFGINDIIHCLRRHKFKDNIEDVFVKWNW